MKFAAASPTDGTVISCQGRCASIAGARSGKRNIVRKDFIGNLRFGIKSLELYCSWTVWRKTSAGNNRTWQRNADMQNEWGTCSIGLLTIASGNAQVFRNKVVIAWPETQGVDCPLCDWHGSSRITAASCRCESVFSSKLALDGASGSRAESKKNAALERSTVWVGHPGRIPLLRRAEAIDENGKREPESISSILPSRRYAVAGLQCPQESFRSPTDYRSPTVRNSVRLPAPGSRRSGE